MEQQPNPEPTPISEKDLDEVKPLTPDKLLGIGQLYIQASFEGSRLERKLDEDPTANPDTAEALHWANGQAEAFRKVLNLLGQEKLVSTIKERLDKIIEQP